MRNEYCGPRSYGRTSATIQLEVHPDRLSVLRNKRSVGGWFLVVLSFIWHRIGDFQTIKWLVGRFWPTGWPATLSHPNYVTVGLFLSGMAWLTAVLVWPKGKDNPAARLSPSDWKELGERFRAVGDRGAVVARWDQDLATKEYQWQVMGSKAFAALCIEMCKEAGRRFARSRTLSARFPGIAHIADDGDRWLMAILEMTHARHARGNLSSIYLGVKRESEFGDIPHLTGTCHAFCLRLFNEEDS